MKLISHATAVVEISASNTGWVRRGSLDLSLAVSHAATGALIASSLLLVAHLRGIVDQEGLEGEALGQQKVSDVVPADGQVVQSHCLTPFHCQLYRLQVCVHGHVDA